MKMVTVKHKRGTITVGDIMETLEKLDKDPNMKISPEMEKSIESLKVFSESIIQPMLNVSSLFTTEIRAFGQLSDEEQKMIDEMESETRQERERTERAAGIPEKDCISLDSHIFLCDLPGKSGLYLYKEGKFHFLKLRPMVVNIIAHLYQIRTHPHPRNIRTHGWRNIANWSERRGRKAEAYGVAAMAIAKSSVMSRPPNRTSQRSAGARRAGF